MTTRSAKFQPRLAEEHASTLERLIRRVREWAREESLRRRIKQERRQLKEMDDAMLADLGISRHEAEAEARRTDIPVERLANLQQGRRV
jgi:uncharacterized protein YjiS (DUF1127 family)